MDSNDKKKRKRESESPWMLPTNSRKDQSLISLILHLLSHFTLARRQRQSNSSYIKVRPVYAGSQAEDTNGFIEGETQAYCLEDITPSAFRIFVRWLYTQGVDAPHEKHGYIEDDAEVENAEAGDAAEASSQQVDAEEFDNVPNEPEANNDNASSAVEDSFNDKHGSDEDTPYSIACQQQVLDLVQSWILAAKFLIPALQTAVIKTLESFWEYQRCPCYEWRPYVYEHTKSGSPIEKFG
ncbi:hypothetical protein BDZ45DRAFT_735941 [Acephala macrosclerotiorum]|nr:hypothetical protein BDZ45DRAFT_735941 [Acephala macrosclerotiorum]